jgi:hypothetical protein
VDSISPYLQHRDMGWRADLPGLLIDTATRGEYAEAPSGHSPNTI